jgi:octaprenyl-diphosphate synthase
LWDNQSTILVGDYLFARAFQLMVEAGNLRVLDILANASATIAEGEVLQLSAAQDVATTEEIYFRVIRGKTAALFSAAMEVGAVIAQKDDKTVQALSNYGDALGISFQIVDDLLDYTGTEATGKNIGDDFRERKLTLPVIKAIAAADPSELAFWKKCISKGTQDEGDLEHALRLMNSHNALKDTRTQALYWAEKAKAALDVLPEHEFKPMLMDLSNYVVSRVN